MTYTNKHGGNYEQKHREIHGNLGESWIPWAQHMSTAQATSSMAGKRLKSKSWFSRLMARICLQNLENALWVRVSYICFTTWKIIRCNLTMYWFIMALYKSPPFLWVASHLLSRNGVIIISYHMHWGVWKGLHTEMKPPCVYYIICK